MGRRRAAIRRLLGVLGERKRPSAARRLRPFPMKSQKVPVCGVSPDGKSPGNPSPGKSAVQALTARAGEAFPLILRIHVPEPPGDFVGDRSDILRFSRRPGTGTEEDSVEFPTMCS